MTQTPTITLRTLAQSAGVSTAAVSNALNGKGRMAEETRERIKEMARELGYRPNSQAASLRTGLSKIIGFVMTPDSDPDSEKRWSAYSSHLLYALVIEAGKHGYNVTIVPADRPELLANTHIDVLFYFDPYADERLINEALRLNIPVLSNDNFKDPRLAIVVDTGFAEMTRTALDYFAKHGSQRPGLLTEIPGIPSDEIAEDIYVEWCKENNFTPRIARGNYGRTDIEEQLDSLLAQGCDAIYSFYEEAETILDVLSARGIKVPEDLLLIAATTDADQLDQLGVTATVFHTDQAPGLSFNEMMKISKQKDSPQSTVSLPWEFVERSSARKIVLN